jgi:predicted  nucleic acid-binding Zn-ribbon protein
MSRSRRSPLLLLLCLLLSSAPVWAQAGQPPREPDARAEQAALKQTLDQIVALLSQLVQGSTRRDIASVLISRIDLSERRLAPKEQELRTLRDRKTAADNDVVQTQKGFGSLKEMEKADTTGSAAQAFEQERARLAAAVAAKQAEAAELGQQIALLEQDIAARRQAIDGMEAQLDALLTTKR